MANTRLILLIAVTVSSPEIFGVQSAELVEGLKNADLGLGSLRFSAVVKSLTHERSYRPTNGLPSKTRYQAFDDAHVLRIVYTRDKIAYSYLSGLQKGRAGMWNGKIGVSRWNPDKRFPWLDLVINYRSVIEPTVGSLLQAGYMLDQVGKQPPESLTHAWIAKTISDRNPTISNEPDGRVRLAWGVSIPQRTLSARLELDPSRDYMVTDSSYVQKVDGPSALFRLTTSSFSHVAAARQVEGRWIPTKIVSTEEKTVGGQIAETAETTTEMTDLDTTVPESFFDRILLLAQPGDEVRTTAGRYTVSPKGKWIPLFLQPTQHKSLPKIVWQSLLFVCAVSVAVFLFSLISRKGQSGEDNGERYKPRF